MASGATWAQNGAEPVAGGFCRPEDTGWYDRNAAVHGPERRSWATFVPSATTGAAPGVDTPSPGLSSAGRLSQPDRPRRGAPDPGAGPPSRTPRLISKVTPHSTTPSASSTPAILYCIGCPRAGPRAGRGRRTEAAPTTGSTVGRPEVLVVDGVPAQHEHAMLTTVKTHSSSSAVVPPRRRSPVSARRATTVIRPKASSVVNRIATHGVRRLGVHLAEDRAAARPGGPCRRAAGWPSAC